MDRSLLVPVRVACPCPGTPHPDGDTVYLYPKLGLAGGIVAGQQVRNYSPALGVERLTAQLTETWVLFGVADWTFIDAEAKPLPVSEAAIRDLLLADYTLATPVADKADELYAGAVLDPLTRRPSPPSAPRSTAGSTSAKARSSTKRRKPPKPSSTSTTQTGVTATTSA